MSAVAEHDPRLDPLRQREAFFVATRAAQELDRYHVVVHWSHVTFHGEEPSVPGYRAAPMGFTFVVDQRIATARGKAAIAETTKALQDVCADACEAFRVGTTPPVVIVAIVPGVEGVER